MFESDLDRDASLVRPTRRAFLVASVSTAAGLFLWSARKPRLIEAASPKEPSGEVTIVEFSDSGQRLKKVRVPRVVKTEDEWRKQLSPNAFEITRHADTEMSFSGQYWNLHDKGLYRCICCDNALFSSQTKFESGTGWPSFWEPIAPENVRNISDRSLLMERTAVACSLCDAHLGHVFDDGPPPTHLRYCMNSASLRFVKQT
jgi:peptide-methionine (R)-S-oxide reductase